MENSPWNLLPLEIIETILLNVPAVYMLCNQPWVCKAWTNILLQPKFWIRKLRRIDVIIKENVYSLLTSVEKNIQVACLYYACQNNEHNILDTPEGETAGGDDFDHLDVDDIEFSRIEDDPIQMLNVCAILLTEKPEKACLQLFKDKMPFLPFLLKLLALRRTRVRIADYHGFLSFAPRYEIVQMLKGSKKTANIDTFVGCVKSLDGISMGNSDLRLSIAVDENNKAINPGIYSKRHSIELLYIKAGTDFSELKMFRLQCSLFISELESDHTSWMNDLVKKWRLDCYNLILLNCKMDKDSIMVLFNFWRRNDIKPLDIKCESSTLTAKDAKELNELAYRYWHNDLGVRAEFFILFESHSELLKDGMYRELTEC